MQKLAECSVSSTPSSKKISIFAYPFILVIYIYRIVLSPYIGNQCRFQPTCSHYSEDAFKKYGAVKGLILTIKRVSRCHPWHEGGYDPLI
ncbi:MAG: membrane protein insertion efficiency factor YidD [Candidatus Zixiibacteriota bacterium]|nr:MAG: membrane protein insertion efficiency factor YidD [candidate division Zixibacteria bacterium]